MGFTASTDSGPVEDLVIGDFQFMIGDLVPAGTATLGNDRFPAGTWDNPYFERWARERVSDANTGFFDTTNAASGNYTYTFTTVLGSGAALAEAPDYSNTHNQRLFMVVSGHNDASDNPLTNNTVAFQDFTTDPGTGAVTLNPDSLRQYVTADACKKCHGSLFDRAAHAPRYLDTRGCVICHSPIGYYGGEMQEDYVYFGPLIHQVHNAVSNARFDGERPIIDGATNPTELDIYSWTDVAYPRKFKKDPLDVQADAIPTCVSCHSNPNNLDLGAGDEIGNYLTHPTAEICNGCHIKYGVDFTTGANHGGGSQPNSHCTICHPAQGSVVLELGEIPGVQVAHDTTPTGVNVPEFVVMLDITEPSNGSYYLEGEKPVVTVTLNYNTAGFPPVDSAIYTRPQDAAGVVGGGLHEAYLQVYGPRARALPVLATDSTTDPNWIKAGSVPGDIEDEHEMFVGGTDPQVKTGKSGFGPGFVYELLPITADMKPGTYMVRVAVADYGRVESGDYHIDSTAFRTIQIKTATEEPKVAGGNTCFNCHGLRTAPWHDERHSVYVDTDECLACHHDTGHDTGEYAHGVPLANRVHAVHFANPEGDIRVFHNGSLPSSRPWYEISFPRLIHPPDNSGCQTCHGPSSSGTYLTNPYMMPCSGCHVGAPGVLDHMRQNGGPF